MKSFSRLHMLVGVLLILSLVFTLQLSGLSQKLFASISSSTKISSITVPTPVSTLIINIPKGFSIDAIYRASTDISVSWCVCTCTPSNPKYSPRTSFKVLALGESCPSVVRGCKAIYWSGGLQSGTLSKCREATL